MVKKSLMAYVAPQVNVFKLQLTQGLLQQALGSGDLPDEIDLVPDNEW